MTEHALRIMGTKAGGISMCMETWKEGTKRAREMRCPQQQWAVYLRNIQGHLRRLQTLDPQLGVDSYRNTFKKCSTQMAQWESWEMHSILGCETLGCLLVCKQSRGLPWWLSGKELACWCRRLRRCGLDPWSGKIPWSKKWQPTPIFLPGKFHGQRSLEGHSTWGPKELATT